MGEGGVLQSKFSYLALASLYSGTTPYTANIDNFGLGSKKQLGEGNKVSLGRVLQLLKCLRSVLATSPAPASPAFPLTPPFHCRDRALFP